MPYCSSCGYEIGAQDRFCKECGEPVSGGDSDPATTTDTDRRTLFGLTAYHWGVVAILIVLQLGTISPPPGDVSPAEAQGFLAGQLLFILAFSVIVVFLLTKAYRFVRSR